MGGMGKSWFDSYAELYEEHDWYLIFDVWSANDQQIKDFGWLPKLGFQIGRTSGLAGNSNHRYVKYQNYPYYMDSLLVSFLQVMASNIVQGTALTALTSF